MEEELLSYVPEVVHGSGVCWQNDELAELHHKSDDPVSMCMLSGKRQYRIEALKRASRLECAVPLLESGCSRTSEILGGHSCMLNSTYRRLCAGVPSVTFAKYSVSSLSRVSVTVPVLFRLRILSWLRGLTLLLSTSRLTTRGEDDRGASEMAETPLAESVAMVTAKKSRAFML